MQVERDNNEQVRNDHRPKYTVLVSRFRLLCY